MSLDEAITFCTQREADYNAQGEALTARTARLKAHIKLALGAIDELMQDVGRGGQAHSGAPR